MEISEIRSVERISSLRFTKVSSDLLAYQAKNAKRFLVTYPWDLTPKN